KLNSDHRFSCFVLFFLHRIFLVHIDISETKDVPMVFEVINDRGERLKPYEVFKGQLLGQLDKEDIFKTYHPLWKESIEPLESIREEEADNFFKYYFRAKYCEAEHDHREFEGDYHRSI